MLAMNQYGRTLYIPGKHPRKELLEKLGGKHASRIFRDKKNGDVVHVGYIVHGDWWTLFSEYEVKQ